MKKCFNPDSGVFEIYLIKCSDVKYIGGAMVMKRKYGSKKREVIKLNKQDEKKSNKND